MGSMVVLHVRLALLLALPALASNAIAQGGSGTPTPPRPTDQGQDDTINPAPTRDTTTGVTGAGAAIESELRGGRSQRTDPARTHEQREMEDQIRNANRNAAPGPVTGQPPTQTAPIGGGPAMMAGPPAEVTALGPAIKVLAGKPYDPMANMVIGTNHMWKGEHDKAMPFFKTSLENGGDGPRTLTFAALSALNSGDPRSAAEWSQKALEQDPHGPLSKQAEAINKLALKRLPKEEDPFAKRPPAGAGTSVPELERPLPPRKAEPGLPPETSALLADVNRLVAQASKAYRAGDMKEAARLAGQALAKDPDDVRALQVRAAAAAKEGDWTAVKKDADLALDMAPGYVPLLLLRAAASVHAKDWRSAKADAGAVLAKEKANATAWRFMGISQAGLGEREESVTSLSRAVQHGDPEARRLLALARSLPPGADAADLVEMLANVADGLDTALAARAAAPPPPARGLKTAVVFAAALLTGIVVGGVIFLAGRSETETS